VPEATDADGEFDDPAAGLMLGQGMHGLADGMIDALGPGDALPVEDALAKAEPLGSRLIDAAALGHGSHDGVGERTGAGAEGDELALVELMALPVAATDGDSDAVVLGLGQGMGSVLGGGLLDGHGSIDGPGKVALADDGTTPDPLALIDGAPDDGPADAAAEGRLADTTDEGQGVVTAALAEVGAEGTVMLAGAREAPVLHAMIATAAISSQKHERSWDRGDMKALLFAWVAGAQTRQPGFGELSTR
jgi:hypothetical protein